MRRQPREIFTEEVEMIRLRYAVILVSACALLLGSQAGVAPVLAKRRINRERLAWMTATFLYLHGK